MTKLANYTRISLLGVICTSIGGYASDNIDSTISAVLAAKTPAEEHDAFMKVNTQTSSYSIIFIDAGGSAIALRSESDVNRVAKLQITWPNGKSVITGIKDVKNIQLLLGQ